MRPLKKGWKLLRILPVSIKASKCTYLYYFRIKHLVSLLQKHPLYHLSYGVKLSCSNSSQVDKSRGNCHCDCVSRKAPENKRFRLFFTCTSYAKNEQYSSNILITNTSTFLFEGVKVLCSILFHWSKSKEIVFTSASS